MRILRFVRCFGLVALTACGGTGSGPSPSRSPASVSAHGGADQAGAAGEALPVPVAVRVLDKESAPVADVAVTFSVTAGGGSVSAATAKTDSDGVAAVTWTLGSSLGANELQAAVSGLTPVTFSATALVGTPVTVTKVGGDAQVAPPGEFVRVPPTVLVSDRFGNPIPDVPVEFSVTAGDGAAWCAPVKTDSAGKASCTAQNDLGWMVGTSERNELSAKVSGLSPQVFSATVRAEVVLELGHSREVTWMKPAGTRLLSLDAGAQWVLWDAATGAIITSGHVPCVAGDDCRALRPTADLAGSTALLGDPSLGFEFRDASDGHLLSRVAGPYAWAQLAADGSYVCAGTKTALSAWARDGHLLFSRQGDYSGAKAFADVAALRVAGGPAGANVIEVIDPSTGQASVGATFSGAFHSWFVDGQRFLTHQSTAVWVYSSAGLQEALLTLPTVENLTGQGQWLWTYQENTPGYALDLYRTDSAGVPVATYRLDVGASAFPTGTAIGISFAYGNAATIIDLSGASPSRTDHALPIAYPSRAAALSTGQWFAANRHGVIVGGSSSPGTLRYYGLGEAWSVAGGGGRAAVATASGKIIYLDAATSALEGEIAFSSSKIQLSSDGAVLAAAANANDAQYETDRTLKLFSLPSATETRSLPYEEGAYPELVDFALSSAGTQLGQVLATWSGSLWTYAPQLSPVAGGAPSWTGPASTSFDFRVPILLLSPSARRVAHSTGALSSDAVTNLYLDGALVGAAAGLAAGWIDEGRVLVNRFELGGSSGSLAWTGVDIDDATGTLLAHLPLPHIGRFQMVSASSMYSPDQNTIYSLETGAELWTGPKGSGPGAVAGGRVVYLLGSRVISEPY